MENLHKPQLPAAVGAVARYNANPMRRLALINQKGGVGKTTTSVNLGAALAEAGQRVVVCDLDPQANLTLHLGIGLDEGAATTYRVLLGQAEVADAVVDTTTPGLRVLPTDIDLSGAEMELAGAFGRETLLRDAIDRWEQAYRDEHGEAPADFLILDCPPSLGLLAVNGLAAANEVLLVVQTQFFALQGLTKLMEVVELVKSRIQPDLDVTGIVACLYDSRLRLAREVLGEIRKYFPGLVFRQTIGTNVKLAEAPSFGQTILQYAPQSPGAKDYRGLAAEVLAMTAEAAPENGEIVPEAPPAPRSEPAPTAPTPAPAVEAAPTQVAVPQPSSPSDPGAAPSSDTTSSTPPHAAPEPSPHAGNA